MEQRQTAASHSTDINKALTPNRIVKWALCQLEDVWVPAHGECPHRGQGKSRLTLRKQSIIPTYVTRALNMSTCGPSCNLTFSVLPCNVECFWNFFDHPLFVFFSALVCFSFSQNCPNSYNWIHANKRRGSNRISWLYPWREEGPCQKVRCGQTLSDLYSCIVYASLLVENGN